MGNMRYIYICVYGMGNSFQSRRSYIQMYWSLYSIGNINMRVFPRRNYPKQYMLIVFDHVHYYLTVGQINKTITVLLIVCVCVCVLNDLCYMSRTLYTIASHQR